MASDNAPSTAVLASKELTTEVAKYIEDIKQSATDVAGDFSSISVVSLKEVKLPTRKTALVVIAAYRGFRAHDRKAISRLVGELEKKTSKHVILLPQRAIVPKNFRRRKINSRTASRTLTAVHEAILEDVVAPADIVGKRTLMKSDGSKVIKVYLDPRDKQKMDLEGRTTTFSAVYKALTNKDARFLF